MKRVAAIACAALLAGILAGQAFPCAGQPFVQCGPLYYWCMNWAVEHWELCDNVAGPDDIEGLKACQRQYTADKRECCLLFCETIVY